MHGSAHSCIHLLFSSCIPVVIWDIAGAVAAYAHCCAVLLVTRELAALAALTQGMQELVLQCEMRSSPLPLPPQDQFRHLMK